MKTQRTSRKPRTRSTPDPADRILGTSPAAHRLRDRVRALAPLRVPVLLRGEPGTGRDHVATALHALAGGDSGALLRVGPRSPAARRQPVPGQACYLDEIGRFPMSAQLHWLDVLRRGGAADRAGRVLASTSEALPALVEQGRLHAGLAERLERFEIVLAPLRERREDVPPLVASFCDRAAREVGRRRVHVTPGALAQLAGAPWPGNVRELAEVVEKLVAFSPDGEITLERVREIFGELPDSVATLRRRRRDQQRRELMELLEACGGNLAEVARRLDLSRGAVIYRAQKYGLLPRRRSASERRPRPSGA